MGEDEGNVAKMEMTIDDEDANEYWKEVVRKLKQHIHRKIKQGSALESDNSNPGLDEIIMHCDFSQSILSTKVITYFQKCKCFAHTLCHNKGDAEATRLALASIVPSLIHLAITFLVVVGVSILYLIGSGCRILHSENL